MGKRVLVVDDSVFMRAIIADALTNAGYEVVGQASDGKSAVELSLILEPDLITLDNVLPDCLGIDILKALKEEGLNSKILMISAVGQQMMIDKGYAAGVDQYLVKPFDQGVLLEKVGTLLAA